MYSIELKSSHENESTFFKESSILSIVVEFNLNGKKTYTTSNPWKQKHNLNQDLVIYNLSFPKNNNVKHIF